MAMSPKLVMTLPAKHSIPIPLKWRAQLHSIQKQIQSRRHNEPSTGQHHHLHHGETQQCTWPMDTH
jgi:hypothetical protein